MTKKYDINRNFFKEINTEEKAYFLGYILADGYITKEKTKYSYNYRLGLNCSIDDSEVINRLCELLTPYKKPIIKNRSTNNIKRKDSINFRVNSKEIVEDLITKGINYNKTLDINYKFNFDILSDDLVNHFFRGFFDGDGSFLYKTKPINAWFSFITTSEIFANQLETLLKNNIPGLDFNTKVTKNKNMLTYIKRAKTNRNPLYFYKEIYNYLYKDANIYLNRKKLKFEEYFQHRGNIT